LANSVVASHWVMTSDEEQLEEMKVPKNHDYDTSFEFCDVDGTYVTYLLILIRIGDKLKVCMIQHLLIIICN
jgi:hypothetical protein